MRPRRNAAIEVVESPFNAPSVPSLPANDADWYHTMWFTSPASRNELAVVGPPSTRSCRTSWPPISSRTRERSPLSSRQGRIFAPAGAEPRTTRSDDPALTARLGDLVVEPLRVVLGSAPAGAKMRPCLELSGDLSRVLDEIGGHDVLQLLVEGGPTTASSFLEAGLVNHIVWYQSASFAGSDGTLGALKGLSTTSIAALRRGRIVEVQRVGEDIRIDVEV